MHYGNKNISYTAQPYAIAMHSFVPFSNGPFFTSFAEISWYNLKNDGFMPREARQLPHR